MNAACLTESGFPPEGTIFPVESLNLEVFDGPHPWVTTRQGAIAENWASEIAANPALFDGRMVFQHDLTFNDGRIEGRAHIIPYSAFLHWRRTGRATGGFHLFAMPLILSSDGALIVIRMAETTANPGRVYSPAGSIDEHDIVGRHCDIDRNMRRETLEETGLDLAGMTADAGCFATHVLNSVAVFRIFRCDMDEAAILERILAHIAADPEPEISGAVGIRSSDPSAHDYSIYMLPVLRWLFDERKD